MTLTCWIHKIGDYQCTYPSAWSPDWRELDGRDPVLVCPQFECDNCPYRLEHFNEDHILIFYVLYEM